MVLSPGERQGLSVLEGSVEVRRWSTEEGKHKRMTWWADTSAVCILTVGAQALWVFVLVTVLQIEPIGKYIYMYIHTHVCVCVCIYMHIYLCVYLPIWGDLLGRLAHMIMEIGKSHTRPSTSWRSRESRSVGQSKSKSLRTREANGAAFSLRPKAWKLRGGRWFKS